MIDHVRDLASVRDATDRLLSAVSLLGPAAVAEPSLLPAWSRGHILAHLARNADALVNVLAGRPMYASGTERETDLERDAPRALDIQVADIRASTGRFLEAAAAPADWTRTVVLRNGVTDAAARVPFRRLVEVELHHTDLGIGYTLEALPGEFADRAIGYLAERFTGHQDVPATTLATDDGRTWRTGGGTAAGPVRVSGSPAGLLGWLSGRRDGSGLKVSGGPLPVLPAL
ncbi:maleylpyruvate isomerase [Streptomyces sulfonofaciens]|uniref:Maleylpyruvate isomerase n=1 Tax=Streptomyces sulfonofaciens TaxID=68272 RepID=A0A919KVE3_9ACTN|nr:maleylpyruvate isomerase family mycothiol-dependent enzyme [Streptomyces sulfonofaciens]GHH73903.1 maleylpyruvate isomerase [Streptomyces sulfonofaciens]